MGEITHAYIVYKDEKKKFHVVPICNVKSKKNSEHHIKPENDSDFVKTKLYYVKWCNCDGECEEDHEHYGYYAAFILLLGESEEDIELKVKTSRRLCIPNKLESEESEEPVIEQSQKKRSITAAKEAKRKSSREILERHKRNVFLTSRKSIVEHNLEDENQTSSNRSPVAKDQNENVMSIQEKEDGNLKILSDANEKLREELTNKEKEMEQLRKMIADFERDGIGSGSTLAIGNTETGAKNVKRALFQEDDCEKETMNTRSENLGDEAEDELVCANTNPLSTKQRPKVIIKSIDKLNLEADKINKLKGKPSKSRDSAGIGTREGDCNDDVSSAPKKQKLEEILKPKRTTGKLKSPVKVGNAGCSSSMNLRSSNPESGETDIVNMQLNDNDEDGLLSSDSDTNNQREGDDNNSTVRSTKRRIERKLKERRSDHMDTRQRTALKHYESDIDEFGLKRYEVTGDNKIYLGERLKVSAINWYLISNKKPTIFFKDLLELIWGQRKLVNRCQDITRVTTVLGDRSPMKELTPQKKRLTYKLFSDHLDTTKMKAVDKMKLLMKVPELYSEKINYLRSKHYK